MTRSSAEIKEIIRETEAQGFEDLRDLSRRRRAQIYKHPEYAKELESSLAEEITTKIAHPSDRPSSAAVQTQGIIKSTLSFHVEGRDPKRSDRQELFYANHWNTVFNAGGRLMAATRRHQTVSPFAVWWLDFTPFQLPVNEELREQYRAAYDPVSLSVIDPMSVAFLTDDSGKPTLATRRFELPYIDIGRRYGKHGPEPGGLQDDEDKSPLTILGRQLPFLRGGRGFGDDAEIFGKKGMVYVIDDGHRIGHYIQIEGQWHQINNPTLDESAKDIANPWGRVGMFIITGRHNDDAEFVNDRFQPLIVDLLGEQRNYDVINTHISSMTFTLSKYGQIVTGDLAEAVILEDKTIPDPKLGNGQIGVLAGQIAELKTQLNDAAWGLLDRQKVERDAVLPPPFLTNPDINVIKNATATAQLQAHETSNREFDDPRESQIAAIVEVSMAFKHFIIEGHLNAKGQTAESNEKVRVRLSGKENVGGTRAGQQFIGERRGEVMDIGPEDFAEDDVLEVSIVASTDSQKALQYQLKQAQVADGAATRRDLVAVTTEDVSGKTAEIDEEAFFQQGNPAFLSGVILTAVDLVKAETGEDLSSLFFGPSGPGNPTTPPPGADPSSGLTVNPPATAVPPVQVTG